MAEINLLDKLPVTKRDVKKRVYEKLLVDINLAKQFGKEYFDGERRYGYGGYHYDGRWVPVAKKIIKHYKLSAEVRILDIGCAKGFLMHDFQKILPKCTVRGLDISEYARDNAYGNMKGKIDIGTAERLPYKDKEFDLVLSINTLHNLPLKKCKEALQEIERVSKNCKFISVDGWRNDTEKQKILDWVLTSRSHMHVDDWQKVFEEAGYQGDFWFCVP